MFFSNFKFSVHNLFFTWLEAVHPLMVNNRNNHKQHDQIRIFHLHDSSILVSVILEIRKNCTHCFCLALFSSIFPLTPCIRLSSTTDPVPASGYIKSTEIWQKINSAVPAFFLSYVTLSLGVKIHKFLLPYGSLRGLNSSAVTEVTEGRNTVTTSWIFSHTQKLGL